jgi:hypothetical protein
MRELRGQRIRVSGGKRVVHHVPEARGDADNRLARIGERERDGQEHREQHQRGREQPERAAPIEGAETDDSCAALLIEQQGRDQEAREDEEEVDAQQPGGREGEVRGVVEDDRCDRDRAESVERWCVPERQI